MMFDILAAALLSREVDLKSPLLHNPPHGMCLDRARFLGACRRRLANLDTLACVIDLD
jgi:hypothetical protein